MIGNSSPGIVFWEVDKPTVNTTDEMNGPYCGSGGGWSEAGPLEEEQKKLEFQKRLHIVCHSIEIGEQDGMFSL